MIILAASLAASSLASAAEDEWHFGIGTGLSALDIKGDLGFTSLIAGPVTVSLDLTPNDVSNYMKTAFGFGGFAAKDEWKITYALKYLELQDDGNGTTPGGVSVAASTNFKAHGADVAGIYQFAKTGQAVWGALGGLRYTKHKLTNTLTVGATTGENSFSHSWTDVLIGLTNSYYFSKEWSWNSRLDAGFGGSDGTYHGNTGVSWRFAESWVGSATVDYVANDFSTGTPGDSDWYLYKGREASGGISVLYLF